MTSEAAVPPPASPRPRRKPPARQPAPSEDRLILFVRHGEAEERGEGKADEERELTHEGHRRMKQIAAGLALIFPDADALYTSPLIRCVQTALWISKGYRSRVQPGAAEALRPAATPEEIREFLETLEGRMPVVVGHEPNLSSMVARLVGATTDGSIEMKKGACAAVRLRDGRGTLEALLPPRASRRLRD